MTMKRVKSLFLLVLMIVCQSCSSDNKWQIVVYQHLYFKKGQNYELIINDGDFSKSKKFTSDYSSDEYKTLTTFRTNQDSIKIYFKLDQSDTTFTVPSDYTTRLVVGSDAYGGIVIRTDKDESSWVSP